MNKQETPPDDDLSVVETNLGKVLALIHRVLPQLDQRERAAEIQAALRKAAVFIESARQAHEQDATASAAKSTLESEIVAAITAAVAVVLGASFKLVSVQPVVTMVPHMNVWALEGRTQIFMSHKVR